MHSSNDRLLDNASEKQLAFWNRWTLGLDFGLGNAGLWTQISGNLGPKTHKIYCIHALILDLCVSCLRNLDSNNKSTCTIPRKSTPWVTPEVTPFDLFGLYHFGVWVCYVWTCHLNPKSIGLKHRSKVKKIAANFVCFWAEISVQSPAFPDPKSRPKVQQFQNAETDLYPVVTQQIKVFFISMSSLSMTQITIP